MQFSVKGGAGNPHVEGVPNGRVGVKLFKKRIPDLSCSGLEMIRAWVELEF